MKNQFYRQRKDKIFLGVLSGLADKFHWNLSLVRFLFILFIIMMRGGLFLSSLLYILIAMSMPYKEDVIAKSRGRGPRQRKEAEPVRENDIFF